VTFPFLFGVMFGDIGHGLLLLIVGIILCLISDKLKNTSMEAFATIRYLILLMGVFAFYNGWIYNEFFAIPTDIFGSCYDSEVNVLSVGKNATNNNATIPEKYGYPRFNPQKPNDCVYPFGMDPRWFQSD
jgi:V-type H+-transporting ATPase subunit a